MIILKKQYANRTGCMQRWRSQPRGACHRDYSHLLSGGRVYVPLCPSYSRTRDRKKQLTFIGVLVALIFALNSVAVIFTGLFAVLPMHLPALTFLLLVPLAIVLAGLLWAWPKNHAGITTDAVLCSLIVTIAGFVLLALLSISGLMALLVHPANAPSGQAAALPGDCTTLVMAIIVFVLTLVLATGGYKLLALVRSQKGQKSS